MKQKITLLLTAILLLGVTSSWAQTKAEVVAYELNPIEGGTNGYATESEIEIDGITWNITGNTTLLPWRIGGKSITEVDRSVFSESTITDNITKIEIEHGTASNITVNSMTLTVSANSDFSNPISTLIGEFEASTTTTFNRPASTDWSNMYYRITYNVTVSATSNKFLQFVGAKFYSEEGGQQQETVATPTFDPASGTYYEAQTITISCTTDNAAIHYTTDGSDPTEASLLYESPITVSETMTLKAKGFKEGYTASAMATAHYTFPTLISIAEAHALNINDYALVQGVVTFIDNRNVYVQDSTGGICVFLNNNTVPSELALGDMVQAYGKRANYNGLIELSGINGNNANEFSILSSGNELPLVTKTIAEILDGGSDALHCIRVKIESAVIGAINTTGNTPLTQGENAINIYKVPELTDIEENQEVDVIGVVGYFNVPQIRVAYASDITLSYIPDPQLTVSPTQLNNFAYTYGEGPSDAQSITVSGSDLSGTITLSAPENFEISLTTDGTYSDTIQLTPTEGTMTATPVYVRMAEDLLAGSYSGNLNVVCDELSQAVALSGNVANAGATTTPVFSLNEGNYITTITVSISCNTEDAVIYYTIDGSEPTESSTVYDEALSIASTTILKALAIAPNHNPSEVATATFTIVEPMTIAEARALQANEYGCVEGIVTFIDNRNVYVQDETAGIVLYLDNNTVPTALELGDKVRAYGKRGAYNGLVELTGIDGTDDLSEFLVLTSGNELPLALKTIAEINEDYAGSNLLQSTRVQIVNAIIGTINPSGNTPIVQDGNTINIYRIPTVEGLIAGDWVTLTGIIGCYNAPQLRIANAEDVEYTHRPTLSANATSLSGMTYDFEDGGPSEIVSFELSGSYLSDAVYIYPSESFEVSTMGGDLFSAEDPTAIYSSGDFSGVNIYVRMKSNLEVGTYAEQLYAVSENADTLFINVEGTVNDNTPTPPDPPTPPTDGNYVRIADLDSLTVGSLVIFAARFDENANDYYAMSNTSSGKPTGVLFTSAIADEDEVLPASIVDEESNYYWTVGVTANGYTFTNALGELIGYSSSTNFATDGDNTEWAISFETSGETTMVPNYEGFVITNVNNDGRAFALNSSHNFGPYAKSNMTSSQAGNYNFYLDLFVKSEGGNPPTPPTPPTPVVATPVIAPAEGTYYEPQEVVITCTTEGATIHYTLDSTDPDETSQVYSTPLLIEETTTVKAIAVKEGYDNSSIATTTFTIQLGFVTIFNQDWEGEWNGWTEVNVVGDSLWRIGAYQGNHYALANGYNHPATIDWLISPAFNLNAYSNPILSFRTAKNYNGLDLEVYFSADYDGINPEDATWTQLECPLSEGGYVWIPSGDIDLSGFSGDSCYIGFKYTCEEGSAAAWEVDDILLLGQTSEPVVTVTPLILTDFTYIEGNGPSSEQSFVVSGLNLSDDIVITAATNFEISRYSGDGFDAESPITLPLVGGNIEETPIYVRLKAELTVGEYNEENILITCADVDTIVITCSGSVTEQPAPADDYIRISDVSALVAGNRVILAARYNETADAYRAIANTLTSGKLSTTEFTSLTDGENEILPADIMSNEDSYYWTVGVTADGYTFTNANGNMIGYGNSGTNFVMDGAKTVWTVTDGISDTASLVPEYYGFNIINFTTNTRAFGLRYYNEGYTCGAYSTSNFNNANAGEYNYFFDIFMQGEGGVPPTPTVATPTFTPDGGTYYEPQEVIINCGTEGATIYYSTSPEGPWEIYTGPIAIDSSMTICFYATMEGYNDSPVVCEEYIIQDDLVIIFNQDWEDDWNGWTEVLVTGDSLWHIAAHSGNHYAYANGYNHPATVDWLISPVFNLDNYNDVRLSFLTARNYEGPTLEVYFTNNYDSVDFADVDWILLDCNLSDGAWNWIESGEISLDDYSGQECRIGFRYESLEGNVAAAWEVDDIMLVSGSVTPTPTLIATPNIINGLDYTEGESASEAQSYTLTAENLEGEGFITVTASENFVISLNEEDEYGPSLEIPFADGQLVDQPVTVYVRLVEGLEVGDYEGTITHVGGNATAEVSVSGTVHSANEPYILAFLPLYIQGNNGSNNNRVPVATAVYIFNLEPNTTYRYTNQFVISDDGPETSGAGNVIYASLEGFYRSTSPSLAAEGNYGEFTTDEDGIGFAWFMNEPTANPRFTPGNHVYLRIRINDGQDGTTAAYTFTTEDYATVLNFGVENDEQSGSAFYVKSDESPMSFAMLLADEEDDRPLYSTSIETTGVDYSNINQYADFYKENVAGHNGWFGGILPNDSEKGVNVIWILDIDSYYLNEYYVEDGQWNPNANTVNPTNGLDEPIFIDLTDDGVDEGIATNLKVWNADHVFVIENGDNVRYTMQVANVLGQTVMSREIAAGCTERINHNLQTGIYIISLRNSKSNIAVKVIVR